MQDCCSGRWLQGGISVERWLSATPQRYCLELHPFNSVCSSTAVYLDSFLYDRSAEQRES